MLMNRGLVRRLFIRSRIVYQPYAVEAALSAVISDPKFAPDLFFPRRGRRVGAHELHNGKRRNNTTVFHTRTHFQMTRAPGPLVHALC